MFKAEYKSTFQSSNVDIVKIRSQEMDYYCNFYMSFAGQSILILCFTLSSLTQTPASLEFSSYWQSPAYWICLALTVNASVHCMITSVFIYVYAYGLSLNGPTGSVLRAIEGMIAESNHVFTSFKIMIFFFMNYTIFSFYIIMPRVEIAIPCTALTVLSCAIWAQHCVHIYERFKIDPFGIFSPVKFASDKDPEQEKLLGDRANDGEVIRGVASIASSGGGDDVDNNEWERIALSTPCSVISHKYRGTGKRSLKEPLLPEMQQQIDNDKEFAALFETKKRNMLKLPKCIKSFFSKSKRKRTSVIDSEESSSNHSI